VVAVALLTGCDAEIRVGDPTSSAPAPSAPAATTTTAPATTAAPTVTVPGVTTSGAALPGAFPLPPGTEVTRTVGAANQILASLSVPDGKQAYSFWTSSLPSAGYSVTSSNMVGGIGEITFSGPGCPSSSTLGISGTTVAVQCNQS
jgi:hypothetical protein